VRTQIVCIIWIEVAESWLSVETCDATFSLVECYWLFWYLPVLLYSEDVGRSIFLQNISNDLPDCMVPHPRREASSWESWFVGFVNCLKTSRSRSYFMTVSQSVCQYVLALSTLVGLATRYYFLSECYCLKFVVLYPGGALSEERMGLQFAV
jgi:hypothetical protein